MHETERLALTVWQGRISPVLDVAREAMLLEVAADQVTSRFTITLPGGEPAAKITFLAGHQVSTLVCGAVSRQLAAVAAAAGITVVPFVAGDVKTVLAAYLDGRLQELAFGMPGCRDSQDQGQWWRELMTNQQGRREPSLGNRGTPHRAGLPRQRGDH